MRVIRFNNGKFGIRKGAFIFTYLDKWNHSVWWAKERYIQRYCQFDSEQAALFALKEAQG